MKGLLFTPEVVRAGVGDTVRWTNTASDRHNSTSVGPTPWDSGLLNPWGGRFSRAFPIAGTFAYYCSTHRSFGMTGMVKIQGKVAPSVGTMATTFTVTLAAPGTSPPTGFKFVVQKAVGGGAFTTLTATTASSVAFRPAAPGTYAIRSGLQKSGAPINPRWFSEALSVTVR